MDAEEPVDCVLVLEVGLPDLNRRWHADQSAALVQANLQVRGPRKHPRRLVRAAQAIDRLGVCLLVDVGNGEDRQARATVPIELAARSIVEYAAARANRHLASPGRIPRDPDAGRNIVHVG